MCDSDTTRAIIINLFSGFVGVCIGAWITYLLQEKSVLKKKKTEILSKILEKGHKGSSLLSIVAQATIIFQSQTIDTHLNGIIRIYSSQGGSSHKKDEELTNKFRELAILLRDDIGISNKVLADEFIKKIINDCSYGL